MSRAAGVDRHRKGDWAELWLVRSCIYIYIYIVRVTIKPLNNWSHFSMLDHFRKFPESTTHTSIWVIVFTPRELIEIVRISRLGYFDTHRKSISMHPNPSK